MIGRFIVFPVIARVHAINHFIFAKTAPFDSLVVEQPPLLSFLALFLVSEVRSHTGGCVCSQLGSRVAISEFVVGVLPDPAHVPGGLYIDGLLANA